MQLLPPELCSTNADILYFYMYCSYWHFPSSLLQFVESFYYYFQYFLCCTFCVDNVYLDSLILAGLRHQRYFICFENLVASLVASLIEPLCLLLFFKKRIWHFSFEKRLMLLCLSFRVCATTYALPMICSTSNTGLVISNVQMFADYRAIMWFVKKHLTCR